jgi:TRAP-type mannitol/chloroaromatic compound transport system substrate-binding protein
VPNIFISYRREDSDIWVGRLGDELRKHFPPEEIFQDIASIDPGAEFPKVLSEALARAAATLIVIGPRWLSATDRLGRRRLDNASDFVRQEVVESLRRPGVRVFPVLVGGAEMPAEDDLPDPLKPLAQRHAYELTVRHWARDAEQLVQILKRVSNRAVEEEVPRGPIGQPRGAEASAPNEEAQHRSAKEKSAAEEQRRLAEAESRRQEEPEALRLVSEQENQQEVAVTPSASVSPTRSSPAPWKMLAVIGGIGALVLLIVIKGREKAATPPDAPAPRATASMTLRAQNTFPSKMRHATAFLDVAREIDNSSAAAGAVRMEVLPAGAVAAAFAVVDAVQKKTLGAAWIHPQYLLGADYAFVLVQGSPFGLDTERYIAWRESGEADRIVNRLYRQREVVGLLCGVIAPHGDIWAKKPIAKVGDFQGLRIRATGAHIPLFTKIGAAVNALPGGEILPAMDRGLVDAGIFSDPASDLILGFPDVSKVYMVAEFAGAIGLDLVINAEIWDQWQPRVRDAVAAVCKSHVRKMAAENARIAAEAIAEMKKREVRIHRMPQSVLAALQKAWSEVRAEYMAASPAFAELAASMTAYETVRERPNLSTYGLK